MSKRLPLVQNKHNTYRLQQYTSGALYLPMSSAKPPSGNRQVPVTNCSSRIRTSLSVSFTNQATEIQNYFKTKLNNTMLIRLEKNNTKHVGLRYLESCDSITNLKRITYSKLYMILHSDIVANKSTDFGLHAQRYHITLCTEGWQHL